jgi:class 3 adenylate cyclase/predicted ATPase
MRCASCNAENPERAKFCMECGAALAQRCPTCGTEHPPRAKYCAECGTALTPPAPHSIPSDDRRPTTDDGRLRPASVGPAEGERRHLTVLFCDLVDSVPLSIRLDPEELAAVLRPYHETCGRVITGYGGHVARIVGDGLLVYFGYPQAHEDDAQRAVRAGLGIVQAIARLNEWLQREHEVTLAVRVGIHTGLVVVGEMRSGDQRDPTALSGETPNIAARLHSIAPPNGVVISPATHRLVEGYFACEALGEQWLKGVDQPVPVYRVLAESAARSRLEALSPGGLTPLVGRISELTLLRERWVQACQGLGQAVLLQGEAGIGKSRLVEALKEEVARDRQAWLTPMQCSSYHQSSALYPVVDLFERVVLRFARDQTPEQKLRVLEGWLAQYSLPLPETVPLFAGLLGVPLDHRYAAPALTPDQQRRDLLQALQTLTLEIASKQPLLLVVEDLHWADPTTLELLGQLLDQLPTANLLAVYTARPEFTPPWVGRTHVTQVMLPRLVAQQVAEMVVHVAEERALPTAVLEQIVAKTDGVPLFVEELTKTVLESGLLSEVNGQYVLAGPLPPLAIPATVQDSLLARLDRLATARGVAQLASCLGREFSYELLRAVALLNETTLQHELERLARAELLYQRGQPPRAMYLFKHALIQDAAYQSLLKSTRQQYHLRIAQVLVIAFPALAQTQPELVAHHYTEAGLSAEAVTWWLRAAQQAVERFSNVEAADHAQKGLAALGPLADTPERARMELSLQTARGVALLTTKGYSAPEVGKTYARARELCRQIGGTALTELSPIIYGQWAFHLVRVELAAAYAQGEELFRLTTDDDPVRLVAHRMLGYPLMCQGQLVAGRDHAEHVRTTYEPRRHHPLTIRHGQDPGISATGYGALCWCLLGFPETALARSDEALTQTHTRPHPQTLMQLLGHRVMMLQFSRDHMAVTRYAEELFSQATTHVNTMWLGIAQAYAGWAQAVAGQPERGIVPLLDGLAGWRKSGSVLMMQYIRSLLAAAYALADQPTKGLELLTDALDQIEQSEDRLGLPEMYRLRGEIQLLIAPDDHAQAESSFSRALRTARKQEARLLELRAAVSLARLWRQQGRHQEAQELLAPIYGWFTEGFDTPDLLEARDLLTEIQAGSAAIV